MVFIGIIAISSSTVFGQTNSIFYAVHLSYDGSMLHNEGIELITGTHIAKDLSDQARPFIYQVYSFSGSLLYAKTFSISANKVFSPPPPSSDRTELEPSIVKAYRSLVIPYFPEGATIKIFQDRTILLTLDISRFASRVNTSADTFFDPSQENTIDDSRSANPPPSQFASNRNNSSGKNTISPPNSIAAQKGPIQPISGTRHFLWVWAMVVGIGLLGIGALVYWRLHRE